MAHKASLLIVEDDATLLEILGDLFRTQGYQITKARDGSEALITLRHMPAPPDMVISDIRMPNMDGFELLRQVRVEDKWVQIPFLFLTANNTREDMIVSKTLGADEYIQKPFDNEELLRLVDARLTRHRAISEQQSSQLADLKRQILRLLNHEFRTPLTLIVNYSNLLREAQSTSLPQDQLVEFLSSIETGTQRLRRLVENFMLLAELQMGRDELMAEWRVQRINDVRALLDAACDAVTRPLDGRTFETHIKGGLPRFRADREALVIALRELIDNAVKFSPPGSVISLTVGMRETQISLSVHDTGAGIAPEEMVRLSDLFHQVGRDVREQQGAGTGLAIVQAIALLHRGQLKFSSPPGLGLTATLLLPLEM